MRCCASRSRNTRPGRTSTGGDDDCNIFFVIRYGDQELSTKRLYAHTDVLYYPEWAYDIDIAETITSVDLEILAVGDNAVFTGDDEKLDVSPSGNLDHDVTWDMMYNSTTLSFQGSKDTLDHDTDAYMKVMLERAVSEKAKVIVINGTGDDGDYGLDIVSTGVYRYSADDQVYLVVLNVTGTSAHFQSGMNAIILPRAIALQCQLNDTLYNLQSIASSPLNNASFYSTDPLKTTASGHIIAVISKNVTASQAELILTMLTHNATGGRIGNNVTISSTALYLLHLPNDILSAIPTFVMNSGMGEGPDYYSLGSVIGDIAGMVFDFLVWVATGGVLLLLAHLVKEGLKAISDLVSTAITAVEGAVDRIVDAFCAMVDWAIAFIKSVLEITLGDTVNSIGKGTQNIAGETTSLMNTNEPLVESGEIAEDAAAIIVWLPIIDGINLLLIIATLVVVALLAISIMLAPYSFLSTLVTPLLIGLMVTTLLQTLSDLNPYDLINGGNPLKSQMEEIIGDNMTAKIETCLGLNIAGFALCMEYWGAAGFDILHVFSIAVGILGLFISIYSLTIENSIDALYLSMIGFSLSVLGFGLFIINNYVNKPFVDSFIMSLCIFEVCVSLYDLFTTALAVEND